uniref:UmuC domain-containing protein n=1 Tax=Rhabditophanes sp. KR3021 TaxID=114890 RepID=A0AC35TPC7_9BILA
MFMSRNFIALIDFHAFFAQVEQNQNISLKGKPVVVQIQGDKGVGQSVSVSSEAEAMGVRNKMYPRNLGIYPNLVLKRIPYDVNLKKPDFTKYALVSAKIFNLVGKETRNIVIEKASLSEMYLDLTSYIKNLMEDIVALENFKDSMNVENFHDNICYLASENDQGQTASEARTTLSRCIKNAISKNHLETIAFFVCLMEVSRIKSMIKEKTGYEASVGVSYSKKIAQFVCKRHGPYSSTLMLPGAFKDVYGGAPIASIPGISKVLVKTLADCYKATIVRHLIVTNQDTLKEGLSSEEYNLLKDILRGSIKEKVILNNSSTFVSFGKTIIEGVSTFPLIEEHFDKIIKEHLEIIIQNIIAAFKTEKEERNRVPQNIIVSYQRRGNPAYINSKEIKISCTKYSKLLPDLCLNGLKELLSEDGYLKDPIAFIRLTASKFKVLESTPLDMYFAQSSTSAKDRKKSLPNITVSDSKVAPNNNNGILVEKKELEDSKRRKTIDVAIFKDGRISKENNLEDEYDSDIEIIQVIQRNVVKGPIAKNPSKAVATKKKVAPKKKTLNQEKSKVKERTPKAPVVQVGRRSIDYYLKKE